MALVALGAALPLGLLGWPVALASLGRAGAWAVAGSLVWVIASGGVGRGSAVVGGVACLGLLAVEPIARRLDPEPRSVLDAAARRRLGALVVAAVQLVLVYVAARVAGTRPTVAAAAAVAGAEIVVAVGLALAVTAAGARRGWCSWCTDGTSSGRWASRPTGRTVQGRTSSSRRPGSVLNASSGSDQAGPRRGHRGGRLHRLPSGRRAGRARATRWSGSTASPRPTRPTAKRANLERLLASPSFRLVEGDLVTLALDAWLEGASVVFHQAAQPGVRASWGRDFAVYVHHNILGTQCLLEALARTGVPRLVAASSSSVYGDAPVYPTTEESLTRPVSPYGVTKLASEHLCLAYARPGVAEVSVVTLRYFTVYGRRQRPDMAFRRFLDAADDRPADHRLRRRRADPRLHPRRRRRAGQPAGHGRPRSTPRRSTSAAAAGSPSTRCWT